MQTATPERLGSSRGGSTPCLAARWAEDAQETDVRHGLSMARGLHPSGQARSGRARRRLGASLALSTAIHVILVLAILAASRRDVAVDVTLEGEVQPAITVSLVDLAGLPASPAAATMQPVSSPDLHSPSPASLPANEDAMLEPPVPVAMRKAAADAAPALPPAASGSSERREPALAPQTSPSPQGQEAKAAAGAGSAGAPGPEKDAYAQTLTAWLNRFKTYPGEARRERVQGVVLIRCTLSAQGKVLSALVARSSGSEILDQAAMDVFRRASPLPRPPPSLGSGEVTLSVPIAYALITR